MRTESINTRQGIQRILEIYLDFTNPQLSKNDNREGILSNVYFKNDKNRKGGANERSTEKRESERTRRRKTGFREKGEIEKGMK